MLVAVMSLRTVYSFMQLYQCLAVWASHAVQETSYPLPHHTINHCLVGKEVAYHQGLLP